MITVWMPVYNEARNLQRAIDSVLSQTLPWFDFVISDNHSTDGSGAIIDAAARKDSRIRKVSPPEHCNSYVHSRYVYDEILGKATNNRYSIFLGGHDAWKPNLLRVLFERMQAEKNAAIVYTDSFVIDDASQVLRQYCGWIQAKDLTRYLIPHHVLLGLTHNIVWGGLWNEEKRLQVPVRGPCVGMDHLLITEMALLGDVLYQEGSAVLLGQSPQHAEGIHGYVRKHLPKPQEGFAARDFMAQLKWACDLVEKASQGDPIASQPAALNMLKHSMISAYAIKYRYNLDGFEGGFQALFGNPVFQSLMGTSTVAMNQFDTLLRL